jgi:hypothetical protein
MDTLAGISVEVDMKYTSVSYHNIHRFILYNVGLNDSKI